MNVKVIKPNYKNTTIKERRYNMKYGEFIREKNAPCMTKALSKPLMERSRRIRKYNNFPNKVMKNFVDGNNLLL